MRLVAAAFAALLLAPATGHAQTYELKIAHFQPPSHTTAIWIENWARKLEKDSNGALKFTILPGGQMGPPPKYYDLVRNGQIDVTLMSQGFTPGRFPLTELSNLPYLISSGEIGAKVLNDPTLLSKYLRPEHKGVKILLLMTNQPSNLYMASKPIRSVEDFKGKNIRFASTPTKELIAAAGATPVGLPPTQLVEGMQKGTIDGAITDYGAAGDAFKLGSVTKYGTEIYSVVSSFCLCMNEASFNKLPDNLKKLIEASLQGQENKIGFEWDRLDEVGKNIMLKEGMTVVEFPKAEHEKLKTIGKKVTEARLKELDGKGLPASEVYKMMKDLADKYAASSRRFGTQ
jgi:TRAP-type C4-dicarboxylate transport system substrate-binding protein